MIGTGKVPVQIWNAKKQPPKAGLLSPPSAAAKGRRGNQSPPVHSNTEPWALRLKRCYSIFLSSS